MAGKYSKNKGSDYERIIAKLLSKEFGVDVRRTPMSGGFHLDFAGDVFVAGSKPSILRRFIIDPKRWARFDRKLFEQLEDLRYLANKRMIGSNQTAWQIWRFDHMDEAYAVFNLHDIIKLLKEFDGYLQKEP